MAVYFRSVYFAFFSFLSHAATQHFTTNAERTCFSAILSGMEGLSCISLPH